MTNKTAILLINLGSPGAPTKTAVRKFLTEFLNDKRVIDFPWLFRKLLVNLIIIPFRLKKSTRLYKMLWTEEGSPLIFLTEKLKKKLQNKLGNNAKVFVGMRYGNPGYKQALSEIKKEGFDKIVVFPLFPQYALSTTETAVKAVEHEIRKQNILSEISVIPSFYNHPQFIKVFAGQIKKYHPETYDHIVFSYHGLPLRQDQKSQPANWHSPDKYAYSKACIETTELIARNLELPTEKFSVGFQSRLSRNWLSPFTDELLPQKLKEGNKKILIAAPSFVADNLETIIEIGQDYRQEFIENGGEMLQLVESLNATDEWVDALAAMSLDISLDIIFKNRFDVF